MTIKSFDVVSTYIAYVQDARNGKRRPVLVLRSLNNGKILRVLVITSKYHNKSHQIQKRYYPIHNWKQCGLSKPSYIDITKHCTLITSVFKTKLIGHLPFKDVMGLMNFIKNYKKDVNLN